MRPYYLPQTQQEQFQEAYDQFCFEQALKAKEICWHGWEIEKCKSDFESCGSPRPENK